MSKKASMVNAPEQLASQVPFMGAEWFDPSQPLFHAQHMHDTMPPSNTPSHQQIAGANGQSSGQPSMVNAPGQLASQVPMSGAEWFHPCQPLFHADQMYYTMPPSNTLSHQQIAGAHGQSSGQSSMVNAPGQLASQVPMLGAEWFHPSQPLFLADHMHYTMPPSNTLSQQQIPVLATEAPFQVTKDPKNDGLGMCALQYGWPAAQARGEGPLGFVPLQFPMTLSIPVPPVIDSSHLQMAYTVQPPPQVAMVNSTYPGWQESTDTPAAPSPGEANWKDKRPLTGGQMAVPGPDLAPYESGVSASSVPLTHQAAQMHRAGSHPPADQSSKEVQQEASGSLPKKKRGRPPKPSKGKGTAK
ncbi:uncharacterized protein LOC108194830 isoform X2 [Daucus carota subsp. sativus]|uniref:uncharacterized protein LOC108194830 isoform X2 n=1 Tax=Daucus carota subsp. sativus TaxID=79200 RepID=UPI003083B3B5